MNDVLTGSLDLCQEKSVKCEKRCFNDKRTSRIAQANWAKVVKILQQFNSFSTIEEKKTESIEKKNK
jgi:predicted transglutaminase-like cysteine proteinase